MDRFGIKSYQNSLQTHNKVKFENQPISFKKRFCKNQSGFQLVLNLTSLI